MKSVWPCPLLKSFVPAFRACPARRTEVVSYSNYPMPSRNGIHSTIALRDTRYSDPPLPGTCPALLAKDGHIAVMPILGSARGTCSLVRGGHVHPWRGGMDMLIGAAVVMSVLAVVGCACPVVGAGYWRAVRVRSTASGLQAIRTGAKREVPMPPETLTGVVRPSFSQSCKPFARHVGRSQLATKAP